MQKAQGNSSNSNISSTSSSTSSSSSSASPWPSCREQSGTNRIRGPAALSIPSSFSSLAPPHVHQPFSAPPMLQPAFDGLNDLKLFSATH